MTGIRCNKTQAAFVSPWNYCAQEEWSEVEEVIPNSARNPS
jgi:hypothetical protein